MRHLPTYLGATLQKQYYIYILANQPNTILYTGVTGNLKRRIYRHKSKTASAFTKKHNINKLVYYEIFSEPAGAVAREKQLKASSRQKKMELINAFNAEWRDLYGDI